MRPERHGYRTGRLNRKSKIQNPKSTSDEPMVDRLQVFLLRVNFTQGEVVAVGEFEEAACGPAVGDFGDAFVRPAVVVLISA